MKKEHIRDYATEAFRFYAKSGGRDKYIRLLLEDMQRPARGAGISKPTESALILKERILDERKAELEDIEAVHKVLMELEMSSNGRDIVKAIEYVYFKDCWRDLEWGDIGDRIHHAEIYIPASQAQIYRWLKKARVMFGKARGLRL